MKQSRRSKKAALAAGMAVMGVTTVVVAAIRPPSPEEQFEAAELVVVGQVTQVEDTTERLGIGMTNHLHAATIDVHCVEKGDAVQPGARVVGKSWTPATRPEQFVGHQGGPRPIADTHVRVYLSRDDNGGWRIGTVTGIEYVTAVPDETGALRVPCGALRVDDTGAPLALPNAAPAAVPPAASAPAARPAWLPPPATPPPATTPGE